MFRLILAAGVTFSLFTIGSCKKESSCIDITAYAQNKYIMRDSIVYLHDSTSIVSDTISFNPISNSGGKVFINQFGPSNSALLSSGCANDFTIDTGSISFYTFFGKGNITGNGNNISITVTRVPWNFYPSDTVLYYCTGVKE